jgi:hypothetical protein
MLLTRPSLVRAWNLSKTIRPSNAGSMPSNSVLFDQKRSIQSTSSRNKSAVEPPTFEAAKDDASSPAYTKRFVISAEVAISKIFPAGLGWQSSSLFAENYMGFATDSVSFALTTGVGDGLGVLLGHCGYYAIKKNITGNPKILMQREFDTGILLASAAVCSGTVWQPIVNALQGADLPFQAVVAGTWVGCGTAFYLGLRAGRTILPGFLKYVDEPTFENSTKDASLSMAIGGATGFFVGTDASYLPDQNFLIDIVGIHGTTPDLMGCAIAGSSTSLGFGVAQSFMNVTYPKDKCWND